MQIIQCDQGSAEWHQARAGCITASMFRVARAKVNCLTDQQAAYVAAILAGADPRSAMEQAGYKALPKADGISRALAGEKVGELSDGAKDYAFQLAIERIAGAPLDDGFQTYAMKRGHELEPAARREHEIQTGLFVERAGFVMTDDFKFGGSADGLIDTDGGSEYKCLISPSELRTVLIEQDFSKYIDQVQGCLWLTGRKWWDFCLYCPALEPIGKQLWRRRVLRDDNYIEALEQDLLEFEAVVTQNEALLREKVISEPEPAAIETIPQLNAFLAEKKARLAKDQPCNA
jgi:hypothetical protein